MGRAWNPHREEPIHVISSDLFNLYNENILSDINDTNGYVGGLVGGYSLNNVRYADDRVHGC